MERAEGRNRSEIPDLDARILALEEDLDKGQSEGGLSDRALLFNLEAYAWAILQRFRAELFERRFEISTNDADVFSILQKHDLLDLAEARKLRQFCEARTLSSRDLTKLDVVGLREMTNDRAWIREILARF